MGERGGVRTGGLMGLVGTLPLYHTAQNHLAPTVVGRRSWAPAYIGRSVAEGGGRVGLSRLVAVGVLMEERLGRGGG